MKRLQVDEVEPDLLLLCRVGQEGAGHEDVSAVDDAEIADALGGQEDLGQLPLCEFTLDKLQGTQTFSNVLPRRVAG